MKNKEIYRQRIAALRKLMKEKNVDAYLILTDDFHASEYVGDYFKCREYISGFDGSAGTLLITADSAFLWTDGRYFIQAKEQLESTDIKLMRSGEKGVPTIFEYLKSNLKRGQCIGFDGRTVSAGYLSKLKDTLIENDVTVNGALDLVGMIWSDRPKFPKNPIWLLSEKYTGKARAEKLKELRAEMENCGAECFLLSSLDDIAWLYNIRGNDIEYNPVALSYTAVYKDKSVLYIDPEAANKEISDILAADKVCISPYMQIYEDISSMKCTSVMLCKDTLNSALFEAIPKNVKIINKDNPTTISKAVKTAVETDNMRAAHIKDGVAVTKLLYWLNNTTEKLTELKIAAKLEEFRIAGADYLGQSFAPIIAYGAHSAIIHYEPTKDTDVTIENNNFLMMDTGGQYLQGTTDITRTVAIGELSLKQKEHYTAVLRGNLDLAAVKFKHGSTGVNLDSFAREPIWEIGMDYNHGTGHGVGYLLNVHEGPNAFRSKYAGGTIGTVLEEGMITSDEPGIYIEGEYGIRLENLVLCKKCMETKFAQIMEFETLTLVPFDRKAILPEKMSDRELSLLNNYHSEVYKKISPYLNKEEQEWLKEATAPINK